MATAVILYNNSASNLKEDAQFLKQTLVSTELCRDIRISDPLEAPSACDLAIHLEVPYYGWMPWANRNIFVVDPQGWKDAWDPYLSQVDLLVLKSMEDEEKFLAKYPSMKYKTYVMQWKVAACGVEIALRKFLVTKKRAIPPTLQNSDCPPISVITLLHNRRKFVDLALHNLLITDYPKDKIEWVVIEDSDIVEEQSADKIIKFGRQASPMSVSYIPLEKKNVPIGAMRNRAIKKAQNDIILFMDDDDHYPSSSFRRRVAWLQNFKMGIGQNSLGAVCCTTIACYDLLKGTSAVNCPPYDLGLSKRISEATLAFRKSWWEARRFPKVSMAEGEGFLEGRENEVLEIPPQQIIVAMSHGNNASSRRIPAGPSGKPSCFWGFPREFLVFLHGLVGVELA